MSGLAPYGTAHPQCHTERGHVCQRPSGKPCIEPKCDEAAGTLWGPYFCPEHDRQRLARMSTSLRDIQRSLR